MTKSKYSTTESTDINIFQMLKHCLVFSIVFLLLSVLMVLVSALIFFKSDDPTTKTEILGKTSLYFSAAICSFIISKKNGKSQIFSGFLFGAIITTEVFALSLFFGGGSNNNTLWLLIIPFVTTLSSAVAMGKKTHRHKHKRHK